MRVLRRLLCLALFIPLATACQRTVRNPDCVKAIRDTETKWNQGYSARDIDRLIECYAEDAVVMPPGREPSVGKKAIRRFLAGLVADPGLTFKFSAARIEVAASGDLGYAQGSYLMTLTDPVTKRVIHDYGSYLTMYRHEADGTWKAVSDMATSEAAAPGVPPAS